MITLCLCLCMCFNCCNASCAAVLHFANFYTSTNDDEDIEGAKMQLDEAQKNRERVSKCKARGGLVSGKANTGRLTRNTVTAAESNRLHELYRAETLIKSQGTEFGLCWNCGIALPVSYSAVSNGFSAGKLQCTCGKTFKVKKSKM